MTTIQKVDLLVVEDHPLFRMGICTALKSRNKNINIIGEAESGADFMRIISTTVPELVLLDIILPDSSGIIISKWLRTNLPHVKILILSSETSQNTIAELVEIGIDGFINKSEPISDLLQAIDSVMSGIPFYGKDIAKLIRDISIAKNYTKIKFTEREVEIIKLCAEGITCRQIADRLNISYRTVDTHKANIFQKLGINSTVEMIKYAVQNGIITI